MDTKVCVKCWAGMKLQGITDNGLGLWAECRSCGGTGEVTDNGTHPYGIAVSQDLLAAGKVKYGDYLCVERLGCYVVNDTMNQRHTNSADIWVATYEQEKAIPPKLRKVVRIRGKNGH
jgi:3D (Asp-Asp-Asp) domain-containing protein